MKMLIVSAKMVGAYRDFFSHREIEGYSDLPFWQRKMLDLRVIVTALGTGDFWKAMLIVAALALAIETVALKLDVRDWRLEFARMSLFLLIAPWIAGGRKRHLRMLLRREGRQDR